MAFTRSVEGPGVPWEQESRGQVATGTFDLLVDAISDCQRAGLVRLEEPENLAISAWSSVHGRGNDPYRWTSRRN